MVQIPAFLVLQLHTQVAYCRWVERVFKRWGWTSKNVRYKSPLKYSRANLRQYLYFTAGIVIYPWVRLKYLDESRCDAKALQRKKGVSPAGQPVLAVHQRAGERSCVPHCVIFILHCSHSCCCLPALGNAFATLTFLCVLDPYVSYSVTLLTSLTEPNGIVVSEPIAGSNDRWSSFETIMNFIIHGHLVPGDVLVSGPLCVTLHLFVLPVHSARTCGRRCWITHRCTLPLTCLALLAPSSTGAASACFSCPSIRLS